MPTAPPLEQETFTSAWPQAPAGPPPPPRQRFGLMRELPVLIVVALTVALLIKTFLIQAFYIPSASMVPTLLENDRILVNKLAYRFREPERGEVVVFITGNLLRERRSLVQAAWKNVCEALGLCPPGDTDFIKRIIALPGETIEVKDDPNAGHRAVYITTPNGRTFILPEPYIESYGELQAFGPFTVPAGSYFLMGDNRGNSSDSRINNFGICPSAPCAVPKERLVGKAFVRIYPFKRLHVFQVPVYGLTVMGVAGGVVRRRRRRAD
ncbi:MAG TPA: signal peptidase I [Actinomycetota bacterium]|nr:signal peptidase I [Actinomycetota bacterium]